MINRIITSSILGKKMLTHQSINCTFISCSDFLIEMGTDRFLRRSWGLQFWGEILCFGAIRDSARGKSLSIPIFSPEKSTFRRLFLQSWRCFLAQDNYTNSNAPSTEWRYQNFDRNRYRDFFSDTKFSETDTETFFPIPNFLKPIPRLFFRYQIFRNRNRYFFSDTKFLETETEIINNLAKVSRPRPKPRLLNIFYIFYNFWTDTQLNELLPTNNGLVHIVHILRNTNFWSPETPLPLCNIVMNFDDPPYVIS